MTVEWEVFGYTADQIRDGLAVHLAHENARDAGRRFQHRRRRVTVDLAKVTREAWGDDLTPAEARQRIAEQQARDHGAGGLF